MFIGRKQELEELNRLYHKNSFQLAVIYGRRRIGKTRMIQEFIRDKTSIYMMAVESNITTNLELLSTAIYQAFLGNSEASVMPSFPDLMTAMHYITIKAQTQKIILAIDEYPYLASADRSISSYLQGLIDHEWKDMNIMLILCGSSMSFMENQVLGYKSPLYGRRTAQFRLNPLDYYESSLFVKNYTAEEQAIIYGITGGVPQYLEMLDDTGTLKENIIDLYLKSNAYLYEEPMNLMKQEMKEPANYNAIIEAIAKGATKLNEISTKVRIETSNVSIYLKALISLGLVEKESAITEEDNKKKTSYILKEQMFRFWFRYIPQCFFLINSRKPEYALEHVIIPDINNYMGYTFEVICRQHVQWLNANGQLPFAILKLGRWWGNNPGKKRQEEIDLLGVNDISSEALFGECKYRNDLVDMNVLNTLIERSELFPKYKKRYYILYSKSGFTADVLKYSSKNNEVYLYTLEGIYDRK